MVAYVIFIKERTRNPLEIETYTMRVAHGRKEVVEGPDFEEMMMLEFPSFHEAKTWYNNRAYQAACEHRFKGGSIAAIFSALNAFMNPGKGRPKLSDEEIALGVNFGIYR